MAQNRGEIFEFFEMAQNSIVYDNNIVNICFKVKAKKDNGEMRAKRAENIRLRGGPKSKLPKSPVQAA